MWIVVPCVSNNDLVVNCDSTTKPENTVITTGTFVQKWTGTGFLPDTKEWTYNGVECGFVCVTNYSRNGSACISDVGYSGQGNESLSTNLPHKDSFKKDYCLNGDYSESYYDGDCGVTKNDKMGQFHGSAGDDIVDTYDVYNEYYEAYKRAYENNLINNVQISDKGFDRRVTRIEVAKLLSNFAINILGKEPDETRKKTFVDVSKYLDEKYSNSVSMSYKLGIMGINMPKNRFRPYSIVPRAEFVTALSRLMYEITDGEDVFYSTHIALMKDLGVIKNPSPDLIETMGYALIMLKRASDLINKRK